MKAVPVGPAAASRLLIARGCASIGRAWRIARPLSLRGFSPLSGRRLRRLASPPSGRMHLRRMPSPIRKPRSAKASPPAEMKRLLFLRPRLLPPCHPVAGTRQRLLPAQLVGIASTHSADLAPERPFSKGHTPRQSGVTVTARPSSSVMTGPKGRSQPHGRHQCRQFAQS